MNIYFVYSNQIEHHYPDGSKQIKFPDGTVRYISQCGEDKVVFPDGTIQSINSDGERTVKFPDGQMEVHTVNFKVLRNLHVV